MGSSLSAAWRLGASASRTKQRHIGSASVSDGSVARLAVDAGVPERQEKASTAPRTRAEFAAAMAKVKKGMPEKEVLALLGKPDDIRTQCDPGGIAVDRTTREVWRYGTNGHLTCPTLGCVY